MALVMPFTFTALPQGWTPVSCLDANFQYLLGLVAPGNPGTSQIVTSGSAVTVAKGTTTLVLSKLTPGATTVTLPSLADANGIPLYLFDWAGNAGPITVLPQAGETIMGLASATLVSLGQGVGEAASAIFIPSSTLAGWLVK